MRNMEKWIESSEKDIYYTKNPNKRGMYMKASISAFGGFKLLTTVKFEQLPEEVKLKIESKLQDFKM
jgi:hypothetical protein